MALVDDEVAQAHNRTRFVSLEVYAGSKGPQKATVEIEVDGKVSSESAVGNGPVDATFNAIKKLIPHTANLQLYQVSAVTEGTDAQAEVTVRLEENAVPSLGRVPTRIRWWRPRALISTRLTSSTSNGLKRLHRSGRPWVRINCKIVLNPLF